MNEDIIQYGVELMVLAIAIGIAAYAPFFILAII